MSDQPTVPSSDQSGLSSTEKQTLATVKRMFAAFSAQDLDALIDTVHPDSTWTYHGANPRLSSATFSGHERVRSFFERILRRLDITAFEAREYVVQGETAVAIGSETGTVKESGEPFHNEWAQKYAVKDGKIVEMVEWNIQIVKK